MKGYFKTFRRLKSTQVYLKVKSCYNLKRLAKITIPSFITLLLVCSERDTFELLDDSTQVYLRVLLCSNERTRCLQVILESLESFGCCNSSIRCTERNAYGEKSPHMPEPTAIIALRLGISFLHSALPIRPRV